MAQKKITAIALPQRTKLIRADDPSLSLRQQCLLLKIPRTRLYYKPISESEENLSIMRQIDEQYLKTPFYGSRKMTAFLRSNGWTVNRKRVQRLMQQMDLEAIYPKPHLSKRHQAHKIYPYLLRDKVIDKPNEVWASDITYVPVFQGFFYLVAVMDWYSRLVLSWQISNSLDADFCVETLQEALDNFGKPKIFNTDQGAQFTGTKFIDALKSNEIEVSMDGKGRALDNVFVERLWRTVKYECIYLQAFRDGKQLNEALLNYFRFYNTERLHQALDYQTPHQIYLNLNPR